MTRVITYGNFDLFHVGHVKLLRRARELGNELYVGLSTDKFSSELKGKDCIIPYDDRKEILKACKYVDVVIPEFTWEQKIFDIMTYEIDVFVMGDDWKGRFDYLNEYVKVIYLPRTENISTTMLKEKL